MKNSRKVSGIILVFFVLLVVVGVSGCTFSSGDDDDDDNDVNDLIAVNCAVNDGYGTVQSDNGGYVAVSSIEENYDSQS